MQHVRLFRRGRHHDGGGGRRSQCGGSEHGGGRRPTGAPEPAVSIIVPVYREAENIPILARRIAAVMPEAGIEWELLLVDDDSRDGTVAVVEDLARHLPLRIEVRRTPPRDLSLSVLAGVQLSLHDRLVVMDADLSDDPKHIPAPSRRPALRLRHGRR